MKNEVLDAVLWVVGVVSVGAIAIMLYSSGSDAFTQTVGGVIFLAFTFFLPGTIASMRRHHQAVAIWATTILLGWTGIGWLIAFIWALTAKQRRTS